MRGLKMAGFLAASATITFVAGGLVFIENANARLQPAAPAIQQGPCATPDHRAFDFWVGQWVVYDPQGDVVGRNTLELKLYGCTLHESWESASGPTGNGHSYSFFDAQAGKWHQTWIDASGTALYLEGGWNGEAMVMSDGPNRVTWTPHDDGSVQQVWQTSTDDGTTWSTVFDGQYVRARQE
ncbi:MAG: hypothetical protein GKS06_05630 [Acidobacteria bacterium]|nr:hypothetical protein [Acidobacteriota bacterium]